MWLWNLDIITVRFLVMLASFSIKYVHEAALNLMQKCRVVNLAPDVFCSNKECRYFV